MPQNIWINVDIKKNDPRVAKLVAEVVGDAHRFDQVIFSVRDKATPSIRMVAKNAAQKTWIANMSREFFRFQYYWCYDQFLCGIYPAPGRAC